jgi:hypothetical protein
VGGRARLTASWPANRREAETQPMRHARRRPRPCRRHRARCDYRMDGPARAPIPNLNVVVVAVTTKDCCRCGNDYKRTREGPVPLATAAAAVTAATWCGPLSRRSWERCRWGMAEQIASPGRPGLPPDHRVEGPGLLRPARRPGSFVMVGATMTKEGVTKNGTTRPPLTRADA